MSQLKAFIEKSKADKELMAKLDELGAKDAGADEIIALAKENGFTITADEIEKMKDGDEASGELKEEDLEAVTGGWTENRYDPKTCKNMSRNKYECKGFSEIIFCDHYRRIRDDWNQKKYTHKCVKDAFPTYLGNKQGEPKQF